MLLSLFGMALIVLSFGIITTHHLGELHGDFLGILSSNLKTQRDGWADR
jgi:hypothetical protein